MRRPRATRGERRAVVLYVAIVVGLSYRPGHPLASLIGGGVAVVVLAMVLMIGRLLGGEQHEEPPKETRATCSNYPEAGDTSRQG
jgi:hypothetical protein